MKQIIIGPMLSIFINSNCENNKTLWHNLALWQNSETQIVTNWRNFSLKNVFFLLKIKYKKSYTTENKI